MENLVLEAKANRVRGSGAPGREWLRDTLDEEVDPPTEESSMLLLVEAELHPTGADLVDAQALRSATFSAALSLLAAALRAARSLTRRGQNVELVQGTSVRTSASTRQMLHFEPPYS